MPYRNPDPVVVGIIFPKPGEVLIIQRKIHPFAGDWALPGGYINEGETWSEALKREVEEEAHIEIRDLKEEGVLRGRKTPNGKQLLLFAVVQPHDVLRVNPYSITDETLARKIVPVNSNSQPRLCFSLHQDELARYCKEHVPPPSTRRIGMDGF